MKNIMLIGGGVGNAVLFSIGKACLEKKNRVLYFAGYRKLNDVFKQALIERASSTVVWACEEGLIKTNRDQDKSFYGNIVDAIISYQKGMLGDTTINLDAIDKIITIGSDKMMKAVNEARKTILRPYLKSGHMAISSVNSPMQCMMKEICAQCVQRHINMKTGEESYVYSCSNQDQDMELVDFDFLSERLKQNSLQEKLTAKWITMFKDIKQQKKEIREQYRAIRKNIDESYAANFLVNLFNQNLSYIKGKTIAAYIPIDGEINVLPLMHNLLTLGYKVAIPDENKPLSFKEWNKTGGDIIPDTIITPVIAFDDHLNRLGFGGGWYDAVIKELQPLGKIFIGVAYEKQYCKDLPIEEHDQKLDIIITETRVRCR